MKFLPAFPVEECKEAKGYDAVNYLCLYAEELSGSTATIGGARAERMRRVHAVALGNQYAVTVLTKGRTVGTVRAMTDTTIDIQIGVIELPPAGPPIELVVGICRPQTIRKVLQAAVSFGVQRLVFLRSSTSEKSYFDATLLADHELRQELLLECVEQTGAWYVPEVTVARRFLPFVQDDLRRLLQAADARGIVGVTTKAPSHSIQSILDSSVLRVVCVGPEKGWSDHEQETLLNAGCQPVSLGPRMLRVEWATAALLAHATGG